MARWMLLAIGTLAIVAAGCAGDASDVRTLRVEAHGGRCEPAGFDVGGGSRVRIVLENPEDAAGPARLVDPEGRIEALTAEPGAEAELFYELPQGEAVYVLDCETAGGVSTEVLVRAGDADRGTATAEPSTAVDGPTQGPEDPDTTIAVSLADYTVSLSQSTVAEGRIVFIATNVSAMQAHELNILQLQPDGSYQNEGGIAPMAPQQGGSVLANLRAGTYRIACQILPGESGSTVDHYQLGMWLDLVVE